MAKYEKKKIQDTSNSGFGKYEENTGGGTPMGEGGKYAKGGRGVWSEEYKKEPKRESGQPRTSDGKFTYNSANGKPLKEISKGADGKSRGKTVNPLLTGGQNGIKIDDVKGQFENKSGAYWDKFKDSWYQKGSEMVLMSQGKGHKAKWSTRVAGEAIWNVARDSYDVVKGDFESADKTFAEGKRGAQNTDEKAAVQLAKSTGSEQAVIEPTTGGMKLTAKQEKLINDAIAKMKAAKQAAIAPAPTPVIPAQPTTQPTQNQTAQVSAPTPTPAPVVSSKPKAAPAPIDESSLRDDLSADASMAKTDPVGFANKYRNEIAFAMDIINKKKPSFTPAGLVSLIANGKVKNIGQIKKLFGSN